MNGGGIASVLFSGSSIRDLSNSGAKKKGKGTGEGKPKGPSARLEKFLILNKFHISVLLYAIKCLSCRLGALRCLIGLVIGLS